MVSELDSVVEGEEEFSCTISVAQNTQNHFSSENKDDDKDNKIVSDSDSKAAADCIMMPNLTFKSSNNSLSNDKEEDKEPQDKPALKKADSRERFESS